MNAKRNLTMPRALALAALLAAAIAGWRWYATRPSQSARQFNTATVTPGDIVQSVTANGPISPVKNVQVGSQISGMIQKLLVDYNAQVTNGQLILRLDPATFQQNLLQAKAERSGARAALEKAEVEFRRAGALRSNELISVSEFDRTRADYHQAQATVEMREAARNRAQVDLDRTSITAPIDGVVISRNVDVGQTVAASFNTPTLFQIANDLRQMRIEANVSEADVGGVAVGQRVKFTVDAYPDQQFTGTVTQVRYAPVTSQNVVNYITIVEVNNAELKLRPGMTANATILTAEHKGVLRIPNAALRFKAPEDSIALASSGTNTPLAGPRTNSFRPPPSKGSGSRPDPETIRQQMEGMSAAEREHLVAKLRAQYGDPPQRPPREEAGSASASSASAKSTVVTTPAGAGSRTVYVVDKVGQGGGSRTMLRPVTVRTGISDGSFSEVLDGLSKGDQVATGVVTPSSATASASAKPNNTLRLFTGGGDRGGPPR
ncbi:MAG: efflux RND transporter periplasmic adaptor subunit [Verrucomicrobiota bacterium]